MLHAVAIKPVGGCSSVSSAMFLVEKHWRHFRSRGLFCGWQKSLQAVKSFAYGQNFTRDALIEGMTR